MNKKKSLSILLLLSILFIFPSCDILKEELGLDTDKEKEEEQDQIIVNVKKTPCAYFTFDGHYNEESGNEIYAYGNPEPTFSAGPKSGTKALSFSRANQSKLIINDGLIDSDSMTISFWAKDIDEGLIFGVLSANETLGLNEMMLLRYENGHLRYVMDRYHCNYWQYAGLGHFTHKAIDDGDWHHIVLVSDHNRLNKNTVTTSLYVDGIFMNTITEEYNIANEQDEKAKHFGTGTNFIMGGKNTPNMKIANLRVYDEWQLPAEEIKKLYENCL